MDGSDEGIHANHPEKLSNAIRFCRCTKAIPVFQTTRNPMMV